MKIKASDYILNYLENKGVEICFCVTGGAAAHLFESLSKSNIKYICNYHEQACAMCAEGYTRIKNKPALVLVTNGPGSSNLVTGVAAAFQDSLPMIVISGQVPTKQTIESSGAKLRQFGVQELDCVSIFKSITKFSYQIRNQKEVKEVLEKAIDLANSGRKGPVYIEIPLDIQNSLIDVEDIPYKNKELEKLKSEIPLGKIFKLILNSKRPLFVIGNGIHLTKSETMFLDLLNYIPIPTACTWATKDIFDYDNELYAGNFGILGERFGNFAIQNSDLLIILGSRMSIPNIGYNTEMFSPNSIKILVDIDTEEAKKNSLKIDHFLNIDLKYFLEQLIFYIKENEIKIESENLKTWIMKIKSWKTNYPVYQNEYSTNIDKVNSFFFIEKLGQHLDSNNIVVTDMGTSFTCTMQALKTNSRYRLFTSFALCPMGFGLPGAIGAYYGSDGKSIVCIAGDGGIQMNIQELQTIIHNKIPIKIFVLNNNGYLAISSMQDNLFNKNYVGCNNQSGVSSPSFVKIAEAYGFKTFKINDQNYIEQTIKNVLDFKGPVLCEIIMKENQLLVPRLQSQRDKEGNIVSPSLENMFPFLEENELKQIMTN
jgi:acetolactate synthase-1/2/3 large subunit